MGVRSGIVAIAAVCVICESFPTKLHAQTGQCGRSHFENAEIKEIAGDGTSMSIADCVQQAPGRYAECICTPLKLAVPDSFKSAMAGSYKVGDHVWADATVVKESAQLSFLQLAPLPSTRVRLFVLSMVGLTLLFLAGVLTGWRPLKLIVGEDNRYSNSKFQMALWFWVLLTTYLAEITFRVSYQGWGLFGAVDIPQNLLVLSGLSAITYGGAKAITTAKADAAAQAQAAAPQNAAIPVKTSLKPGEERFFRDLVQDDYSHFDFGDFQMVVVTLIAVSMYLILVFHSLAFIADTKSISLPDVDTTIPASFGLGQGAYLTKKAAGNVGSS